MALVAKANNTQEEYIDEEEEEELFEINLEIVDHLPPPQYYSESYFTATSKALLANCLLPVSHISSAVPICNVAFSSTPSFVANVGEGIPSKINTFSSSLGDFGLQYYKEMKASKVQFEKPAMDNDSHEPTQFEWVTNTDGSLHRHDPEDLLNNVCQTSIWKAKSLNTGIAYNTEEMATTPNAQMQMEID
ncbi:hypothetical protein LguiA_015970 [Lonicera macranthoides]